jgi:hypothetical protein
VSRKAPRIGYLAESGFQHAFPVEAMLHVQPGPLFTTGERLAERFRGRTEVVRVGAGELSAALAGRGIEVLVSSSHLLAPRLLRERAPGLRVVFVSHGESDKTHGQGPCPQPSWQAMPVNLEFDLVLVASHHHFRTQLNPCKELVGYLKHDLFTRGGHGGRSPEPGWVLWAPGWGRHSSVSHWLDAVVDATGRLGLRCLLHFHPHSHVVEPHLAQRAQALMLRHEHLRVAQCFNLLELMARSALLLGDVSSVTHDWLMFDRPLVLLDHPGLSFPEEKSLFPVGRAVARRGELEGALRAELENPERGSAARRQALAERYFQLDGRAAERAREAILRHWHGPWARPT